MSGTIPLSLTQQFDIYGKPLAGGQLFLIAAGTVSTPQDGFQDSGLTIKMPYPITLDAAGRIPQFFLADGTVKVRLQDVRGVVQLASDGIQVIGPSGGGGGGTPVDPTTLIQTGNIIARYGTGVFAGYVRLNNLTIGSSTSGATERANADCQALFQFLWGDLSLAVIGGRGASAAADWAANKQITTPDWRGYALGALDDMGNTAAGRLSSAFFGSSPVVLGAVGGGESWPLSLAQLPTGIQANNLAVPLTVSGPQGHTLFADGNAPTVSTTPGGATTIGVLNLASPGSFQSGFTFTGNIAIGVTSTNTGGQAHRTIGPRKLCTFYIKL